VEALNLEGKLDLLLYADRSPITTYPHAKVGAPPAPRPEVAGRRALHDAIISMRPTRRTR
jgi:hypothetical protein